MNDQPAIVTKNLSKTFGEIQAVRGVSFQVKAGEIFSLLGPNGAGWAFHPGCLGHGWFPEYCAARSVSFFDFRPGRCPAGICRSLFRPGCVEIQV